MAVIGYNPTTPGGSVTFNSTASAQARLIKTGAYVAGAGDTVNGFWVYIAGGSGGDSVLNWAICSTSNVTVPNGATVVHSGAATITAAMKAAPGWYSFATSFELSAGVTYIAQIAGTSVTGIAVGGDTLAGSGTFRTGSVELETPWSSTTSWGSSGNMAAYFNVLAAAPVFSDGPEVDAIADTTTSIKYTSNSSGTGAVVITAHNASQPSDGTFDAAAESITASVAVTKNITGLTAATRYKAWVQIKNADGARTTSSVLLLTSNTGATSRIVLTSFNSSALNKIKAVSNLIAGDIVEIGAISGSGAVDVTVDGTVMVDDGVTAFQVYRGTLANGWDAAQLQIVPPVEDSVGMRTVSFLASPDLSTWTQVATGGGTVTLSGTNNKRATITNDGTRTYIYKNAAVTAGRWYALTADIVSAAANFDADGNGDAHFVIYNGVADGDQFYKITSASDGKRCGILFKALTTGSESFRVGVGAAGTSEAGTLVIENLQICDYGTTRPSFIDKFYDVSGAANYPLNVHTKYEPASTYVSGVVTQIDPSVIRTNIRPGSLVLNIGDSYGLNDRYPRQIPRALRTSGQKCSYYNAHIGGQTLAQIRDRLVAELTGANYPAAVAPLWVVPKTLVLEGGGNSILDNMAAATVLGQLDECITLALANGVEKIVLVNIPPFRNYSSYTLARDTQAVAYNALLGSTYSGYPVYNLRSAMAGDVNTDALSNRANGDSWDYDSGDGLHPTLAASIKIGSGISSYIATQTVSVDNQAIVHIVPSSDGKQRSAFPAGDYLQLTAPSGFSVSISASTVSLSWNAHNGGVAKTAVEVSVNSLPFSLLATKNEGQNSHSATFGYGSYIFRISAVNGSNSSGFTYSQEVTLAPPQTQLNSIFAYETFSGVQLGALVTNGSIIRYCDGVADLDPTGTGEKVAKQTIVPGLATDNKLNAEIILGNAKPRNGDEIWFRFYVYVTPGSDLYASPRLKWMRVKSAVDAVGSNGAGWPDVYRQNDGTWGLISSTENSNGGNTWVFEESPNNAVVAGQWQCHEMYVRAGTAGVNQGGTGIMRFWVNGNLVIEHLDSPTMKNATDYYLSPVLWSYWNGQTLGPPPVPRANTITGGNQIWYWKRFACALKVAGVRDDSVYLTADVNGNKMIGPGLEVPSISASAVGSNVTVTIQAHNNSAAQTKLQVSANNGAWQDLQTLNAGVLTFSQAFQSGNYSFRAAAKIGSTESLYSAISSVSIAANGQIQFTPSIMIDAEAATIGQTYQGAGAAQWSEAANETIAQDTVTLYGSKAWRMKNPALQSGFGNFGGIKYYPVRTKGQSVQIQVSAYFPSATFDFTQASPHLKFLRFLTRSSANVSRGYQDIYISNDGRLKHIYEGVQVWTNTDQYVQYNTWETFEYRVDFDDIPAASGGTGRIRIWRKISGQMTKILDVQNQKTLVEATDNSNALFMFTYWNGEPAKPTTDQICYADRIIIETDLTKLVETDASGDKIIGGL